MQFFIGIVPPDEYKQQIVAFRNRWSSNGLRNLVEPHITVKAQSGLTEDLEWIANVKETISTFPCFQISLLEPATFGKAVVFLSVDSREIFNLHQRLMDAVSPPPELIKRYLELDRFHPHLTLGQTRWGMAESEIEEMKVEARNALAPFPIFTVEYIRVYKEIESNKYVQFEDIRLA